MSLIKETSSESVNKNVIKVCNFFVTHSKHPKTHRFRNLVKVHSHYGVIVLDIGILGIKSKILNQSATRKQPMKHADWLENMWLCSCRPCILGETIMP